MKDVFTLKGDRFYLCGDFIPNDVVVKLMNDLIKKNRELENEKKILINSLAESSRTAINFFAKLELEKDDRTINLSYWDGIND